MRRVHTSQWCTAAGALGTVLLFLLPMSAAAGDAKRTPENPARRLLEKSSKSLGENEPWTTRVERGLNIAWNTPGWGTLRADYARYVKKPDKVKIDQDNSAYDHPFFRTYYANGGDAWYVVNLNPGRNPQVTTNMQTLLERVDGIAYYLAACDTFFSVPAVPDDSLLAGAAIERVGCVLKGDTTLFDIDAKTHRLSRRIENKGKRSYLFEDYRKTEGRLVPFHVTVYDEGRKSVEFLWNEVSFNEKLDDAIFEENRPPQEAPPK